MKVKVLICMLAALAVLLCGCGQERVSKNNIPQTEHIQEVEKPSEPELNEIKLPSDDALSGGAPFGTPVETDIPSASKSGKEWEKLFDSSSWVIGSENGKLLIKNNGKAYVADSSSGRVNVSLCKDVEERSIVFRDIPDVKFIRYGIDGKYFFENDAPLGKGLRSSQASDNSYTLILGEGPMIGWKIYDDFTVEPVLMSEHSISINDIASVNFSLSPDPDTMGYLAYRATGNLTRSVLFIQKDGNEMRIAEFTSETDHYSIMKWLDDKNLLVCFSCENTESYFVADTDGNIREIKGGSGWCGASECDACGNMAAFYSNGMLEIRKIEEDHFESLCSLKLAEGYERRCFGFTDDAKYYYYVEVPEKSNATAILTVVDVEAKSVVIREELPVSDRYPTGWEGASVFGHKICINCYSSDFGKSSTLLFDIDKALK